MLWWGRRAGLQALGFANVWPPRDPGHSLSWPVLQRGRLRLGEAVGIAPGGGL